MGRGFLSGIFWGGIVGALVLFASSLALERQSLSFPKPEASAVEVPGGSEFDQARPESDPVVPEADAPPAAEEIAGVEVPEEADEVPSLDNSALEVPVPTTTQDAPETLGEAPEDSEAPEASATEDTEVASETDTLETPEAPTPAPETAQAEPEAPAAEVEEEPAPEVAVAEDTAPEAETDAAALPEAGEDPAAPNVAEAPQVEGQIEAPGGLAAPQTEDGTGLAWLDRLEQSRVDEAPSAPQAPPVSDEPSLPPVGTAAPEAPEAPVVVEAPVAEDNDDPVEQAVAEAMDTGEPEAEAPAPEVETAAAGDGESLLRPVEPIGDRDDVVTGRLPQAGSSSSLPTIRRLGESEEDEAEPEVAEADETPEAETDEPAGPALTAFASEFDAPAGLPLMSIILLASGMETLEPTVLEALPQNVSFAIDASDPEASAQAQAYRAAGREVVMIPALPAGAAPQDIEQALAVNFERVPQAVAVMDVSGSSFQSDRAAVAQVVEVVASSGHGLITFPRGLNTAHQEAQRAGVPTGLIFRNLDGGGETPEQIGRALDRAAFRARQDEAVILVGTTGSSTLSALSEWALGTRAESVAIAPVSAALGE